MEFAEIYLELRRAGGVKVGGSAVAQDYEGHIELFDWSWGIGLGDLSPDGKSEERQAKCNMVAISKPVDRATTALLTLLQSGETCDSAVLTMTQRSEKPVVMKVMLKNVRLMSYDLEVECADLEVVLSEEWEMSYDRVEIRYSSAASGGGMRTFMMETPPGVTQDEPVRSPRVSGVDSSDDAGGGMGKDEIIKLIEEQLKKHKLNR
jgi:type VI protein secretion system component Hcp